MRVGIITHYMPPHIGGIEQVAETLYFGYRAAGFDVRWLAAREPSSAPAVEDGRIRVKSWNGFERRLGVPWPVIGVEGIREIRTLVRWADILHVHDSLYASSSLATFMARSVAKPVIVSQHIGFVEYQSVLLNAIERLANQTIGRYVLRSATRVVYCTLAAQEFAASFLSGKHNGCSIPNGIDTDRFRPPTRTERANARAKLNLPESARVVLFVGRLVEKKGIRVVSELIRALPSHYFLIAGDGPLRSLITDGVENCTWLTSVLPEAMPEIYQAADLFVLPSHGEGLPLSVQEAMSTGLPVVVSRDEVFVESLSRENACIVTERAANAFQHSILELDSHTELTSRLSERARALAVSQWSMPVMITRYLHLIREIADGVEPRTE